MNLQNYLGKRIVLVGDHPWSGETGIGNWMEKTLVGEGLRVTLDRGNDVFVFHQKHVKRMEG